MNGIVKHGALKFVAAMCLVLVVLLGCKAPAGFEVRSLTITPSQVSLGEEVTVTGEVRNNGSVQGTYEAILTVDGDEVERASVVMAGETSKTVTFALTRDAAGSYQVGLGDMSATLMVSEEAETVSEEEEAKPALEYIELKYDDGESDGSKAFGVNPRGYGHVVRFKPTSTPFTVDRVKIYGQTYGEGCETREVQVVVRDLAFNQLDYSRSSHEAFGETPAWVTVEMNGVSVEDDFYVVVMTDSPKECGIRVFYDSDSENLHSEYVQNLMLAEWSIDPPKAEVNWMIRVEQGAQAAPEEGTGEEPELEYVELKYDDGESDGASAFGTGPRGYGHVVRFTPTSTPFTVDGVKIYGQTYGEGCETREVQVVIRDLAFNQLDCSRISHEAFGETPAWVSVEMNGVSVEDDFYVVVMTDSPKECGIRVFYDLDSENLHSEYVKDGKLAEWSIDPPKAEVNWMIRVEQGLPPDEQGLPPEEPGEGSEVAGEAAAEIHERAWAEAAANCESNNYYKYSLYSSRSLAVSHPEVYLQADTVWMDMICNSGGWSANYLLRDRKDSDAGGWDEIRGAINDGFRKGKRSGSFDWDDFNWQEHRQNTVDLFDYYEDVECLGWLDNRMVFVWSAMNGLDWRMPFTSLAEAQYLQMLSEGKEVYLLLTEDRKGYVAELAGEGSTLHNPLTGELTEDPDGNVVLVMNNEHVWYPLMLRDDRAEDPGLAMVVRRYCKGGALPAVSEYENSLIDGLAEGTALGSSVDLAWAKLVALRGLNQETWRARPLRELSAEVFPERYDEDSGYSDSPQEQQCLGMVITELGNRLSPTAASWAQVVQQNCSNPRKAFEELGSTYLEQFHRTDSHSEWVYGDYYRCWLPNLDDKLVSGLGDCFVEAGNTMAALSLAAVEGWQVYETNWWSLERSGGHVICGAYTPDGAYNLSNGLFQTQDQSVLNGPLWDGNERLAQEMIYNPEVGFIAFVQTENAANYSDFYTPFTNLTFEEAVAFLQHLKTLESGALIAKEQGAQQARSIDEYLDYIAPRGDRWEDNMADWPWHVERAAE